MKKNVFTFTLVVTFFLALTACSGGNIAAGKQKSATCAPCHGPGGNSTSPQFPRLAGQYEDYIVKALTDYKSGARKNPIMSGMAASLSADDIANLAAYYSSQSSGLYVKE
jgi:cytochrome c553